MRSIKKYRNVSKPFCGEGQSLPKETETPTCEDNALAGGRLSLADYSSFVAGGVPCTLSTFSPGVMPRV